MKIKKKTRIHRNDFNAIYICEFCGKETEEQYGYNDSNFYQNVIPNMECEKCGKKSLELLKKKKEAYKNLLQLMLQDEKNALLLSYEIDENKLENGRIKEIFLLLQKLTNCFGMPFFRDCFFAKATMSKKEVVEILGKEKGLTE